MEEGLTGIITLGNMKAELFSRYLEEMAGKGWYIDGYVFDGVWRFRKGKPSNRHIMRF